MFCLACAPWRPQANYAHSLHRHNNTNMEKIETATLKQTARKRTKVCCFVFSQGNMVTAPSCSNKALISNRQGSTTPQCMCGESIPRTSALSVKGASTRALRALTSELLCQVDDLARTLFGPFVLQNSPCSPRQLGDLAAGPHHGKHLEECRGCSGQSLTCGSATRVHEGHQQSLELASEGGNGEERYRGDPPLGMLAKHTQQMMKARL